MFMIKNLSKTNIKYIKQHALDVKSVIVDEQMLKVVLKSGYYFFIKYNTKHDYYYAERKNVKSLPCNSILGAIKMMTPVTE